MSSRLSRGRSTPAIRAMPLSLLALPLLVPGVGADDHHDAPPPDDPAPVAHLLHGRPDLHLHPRGICVPLPVLLEPIHHTASREVVRRELHLHPIPRED